MSRIRCLWIGAIASGLLVAACNDSPQSLTSVDGALDVPGDVAAQGATIPFAKLRMFLEFNSTDNDLGVQLLLDGDDWLRVDGVDPRGRQFVEVQTGGRLRELGLTELFWESAEPSPEEVLALIPAGVYKYTGKTVDGERLIGTATLSHTLPAAPTISPANGVVVNANNLVVTWQSIASLASFQVIVADEASGMELVVDLLPSRTSFRVPTEFVRPGRTYKIEVLAVATNGNKTISEVTVQTQ